VLEPRELGLLVALGFGLRLLVREGTWLRAQGRVLLLPAAGVAAVVGSTIVTNDRRVLLFAPSMVCAALLLGFGRTLVRGPSLVETLALREVDHLPEEKRRYCRRVTLLWCGFFFANGAVAFWLGWRGSLEAWTLWNGLLAYLAIGTIFGAELIYRRRRFPGHPTPDEEDR
jgi:uncharacterized membrane protein